MSRIQETAGRREPFLPAGNAEPPHCSEFGPAHRSAEKCFDSYMWHHGAGGCDAGIIGALLIGCAEAVGSINQRSRSVRIAC